MASRAIIIGASSGIGEALAVHLSRKGYALGLAARREKALAAVAARLDTECNIAVVDVTDTDAALQATQRLIEAVGGVDLFVLSAGTGEVNKALDWATEEQTIQVNALGFAAMANAAAKHLEQRGHGTLIGLSSIAAIRGNGDAPAYGATKAFASHYLDAIRHRFVKLKLPIQVLDVQPGFVDTAMAKGEGLFWVAPPEKAAQQIIRAMEKGKTHVYITRRWRLIAWVLKILPEWLYNRII